MSQELAGGLPSQKLVEVVLVIVGALQNFFLLSFFGPSLLLSSP